MGMKNIELGDDLHMRDPFRNSFFVTDVAATWERKTLEDSLQVYFSMCTKIHLSTELDLDIAGILAIQQFHLKLYSLNLHLKEILVYSFCLSL